MTKPEHISYSVYLGSDHYKMKVSEVGYNQILEIVKAAAVCGTCGQHYSEERPNVAGLLCLRCFLQQHSRFTFIGLLDKSIDYERYVSPYDPFENPVYLFLDEEGHAHVTEAGPGESEKPSESSSVTLQYWHFPRPQQAEQKEQIIDVSGYSWSIYGDIINDDSIIIQHGSIFYKNELLFMVKRNGSVIQINRRKPMHRQMLADARAELEATRNESGKFWIDEEWKSWIQDEDVYRRASKRVSEAMSAARAEREAAEEEDAAEPERVTE